MATFILLVLFLGLLINSSFAGTTNYNVLKYGARPNGVTDSTKAFLNAWAEACDSTNSTMIYVPKGRYLVSPMIFKGACKSPSITFRIDGTLWAPQDYTILASSSNWLSFEGVSGVSILGGSLDAKGASLWACKLAKSPNCPSSGATSLSFTNSNNIKIKGLLSLNSQMFHIVFNGCKDVYVQNIKVVADGNSPNTDGIHVQLSTDVAIINSTIKTGDDCISIGPGTKNLWVEGVRCGPGHGISIGSLAKTAEEEGVQNVTVKRTVFTGTTNGFRIKSWARPTTGFVQGVRFIDAIMQNVQNPILIDQHYCPHNLNCPTQVSGLKISDVVYEGILGTSATQVAMKFDCSSKYPCKGIKVSDVKLTHSTRQVVQSFCANAVGKAIGIVQPNSCL
ncbi:polygalacturonase-like [Euphorbia lathyris]|uniref:polygalacturonase-like n=1 Tax=Euphorbia lathyris TaxID=212925 RepID=UPI003313600D